MSSNLATEIGEALMNAIEADEITDSDAKQFAILLEAFDVYLERNARYRDLWKDYGAQDSAHHCKSKALRMYQDLMMNTLGPFDPDDAIDLVNYAVFTIRNVRDGRLASSE